MMTKGMVEKVVNRDWKLIVPVSKYSFKLTRGIQQVDVDMVGVDAWGRKKRLNLSSEWQHPDFVHAVAMHDALEALKKEYNMDANERAMFFITNWGSHTRERQDGNVFTPELLTNSYKSSFRENLERRISTGKRLKTSPHPI